MNTKEQSYNIDEKRKDIIRNINQLREIGISQKDISKATTLSEDEISKIKSETAPLKKTEKINELYYHLNKAVKCESKLEYKKFIESNALAESKANYNIEKYLNLGNYTIHYQNSKSEYNTASFALNKDNENCCINVVFNEVSYYCELDDSQITHNEIDKFIELHFSDENKRSIHLFLVVKNAKCEFYFGYLFRVNEYLKHTIKKVIVTNDNLNLARYKTYIKSFFTSKNFNLLEIPISPINTLDEFVNYYSMLSNSLSWETVYTPDFTRKFKQYDLFLSTPISGLSYAQFVTEKEQILPLINFLEENGNKVFWEGTNINDKSSFEEKSINIANNVFSSSNQFNDELTDLVHECKRYIFIDIVNDRLNQPSSQLFQLGWILGQSSGNLAYYFVNDTTKIPRLVRSENLMNFEIVKAKTYMEILDMLKGTPKDIWNVKNMIKDNL